MQRSVKTSSCALVALLGASVAAQAQFGSPQNGQSQGTTRQQPRAVQPGLNSSTATPASRVVAKVNGDRITDKELQVAVQQQKQSGQVPAEALPQLRTKVLNRLVESRLVEQHVRNSGPKVASDEVESVVTNFERQLQSQGLKLQDYLTSRGLSERGFQKRIHGSLAWQKYQQRQLTEENLQQHLQRNQAQFGTTELARVRNEVVRSYVGQLWQEIVRTEKPKAKIEVTNAGQQQPPTTPPAGFPRP